MNIIRRMRQQGFFGMPLLVLFVGPRPRGADPEMPIESIGVPANFTRVTLWGIAWKRKMRGAEYEPTDAQRALVENASAFGLTQAEIAERLGIDESGRLL